MARRRLIDPAIWQCGHFKRFDLRRRLLWIGIITMADDKGKLKGEPEVVNAFVFPFDNFSPSVIEEDLAELQKEGLIKAYEVDGDRYIRIPKWAKYQKPSHATPSKIPSPPLAKDSGTHPENLARSSRNHPDQVRLGKEKKGEVSSGKGSSGSASASSGAEASPAKRRPLTGVTMGSLERLFKEHGFNGMMERLREAGIPDSELNKLSEADLKVWLGEGS